jgi:hypothetical protein
MKPAKKRFLRHNLISHHLTISPRLQTTPSLVFLPKTKTAPDRHVDVTRRPKTPPNEPDSCQETPPGFRQRKH